KPGVVDKDIESAEGLQDAVGEGADLARVADVGGLVQDAAGAQRLGGTAQLVGVAASDRHTRSLLEEKSGRRQTDAAAAARNQYRLVLQVAHAGCLLLSGCLPSGHSGSASSAW